MQSAFLTIFEPGTGYTKWGFQFFANLAKNLKKFEKIGVPIIGTPIYCWHTLIVWLMGLSIPELVDK